MVEVRQPPSAITRAGFGPLRKMLHLIARPTTKSATRIGPPFVPSVYKPRALMSPLEPEVAWARAGDWKTGLHFQPLGSVGPPLLS